MFNPLVTVCVITYNSEKYVFDTLESISSQSYQNIELIVSDDCSSDGTVELVDAWLEKNKSRFVSVQLITAQKNTGVTGNCNRAYKAAHGVYVKDIGGDDMLLPEYIERCISYFSEHLDCSALFTDMRLYVEEKNKFVNSKVDKKLYDLSAEQQYFAMQQRDYQIPTPAVIYKTATIKQLGYFDERFPMWEDGPMYFKLTKHGIKLEFLDFIGVTYRVRENSLSNKVPYQHKISLADFYFKEILQTEIHKNLFKTIFHVLKFCLFKMSFIPFVNSLSDLLVR